MTKKMNSLDLQQVHLKVVIKDRDAHSFKRLGIFLYVSIVGKEDPIYFTILAFELVYLPVLQVILYSSLCVKVLSSLRLHRHL